MNKKSIGFMEVTGGRGPALKREGWDGVHYVTRRSVDCLSTPSERRKATSDRTRNFRRPTSMRFFTVAIALFVALSLTGCDALQRKFTRKKKAVKPVPRVHQLKKYDIKPSPALYSKHYAYWQSWMSELVQDLGGNRKRDKRCISEALSQLYDMQNLLVEEKAEELEAHVAKMEQVRDTITNEDLTQFNKSRILMTLEHEDRVIKSEFNVAAIKGSIRENFD